MKKIYKKLERYQSLSKGLKASQKMVKTSLINKHSLALMSLPALTFSVAEAQCFGPENNGNEFIIAQGVGNGVQLNVNGQGGNDFSIYNGGGVGSLKIRAIGTEGGQVASGGMTSIKAFATDATIDSGLGLQNNLYIAFNRGAGGAIQNGETSNIGFKIGSNFGFINLTVNHNGEGGSAARYELTIPQYGTSVQGFASANNCSSLPVELLSFKAKANQQYVHLSWQTASEQNNAGFELERSENGKQFKTLAFIEGKGTTLETQDYYFEDKNLHSSQLYYYRLKQIDFDGQFEYSDIITAEIKKESTAKVDFTPNPANNSTTLNYTATRSGELNVQIFDTHGKQLLSLQNAVVTGQNNIAIDLSQLAAGMYFVKLDQAGDTSYQSIVVE